ncbi:MAG: hypothetical protein WAU36_10340 [Cyclobacteriaceae bacterium]
MKKKHIIIIAVLAILIIGSFIVTKKLIRKKMEQTLIDRMGMTAEALKNKSDDELQSMIASMDNKTE